MKDNMNFNDRLNNFRFIFGYTKLKYPFICRVCNGTGFIFGYGIVACRFCNDGLIWAYKKNYRITGKKLENDRRKEKKC